MELEITPTGHLALRKLAAGPAPHECIAIGCEACQIITKHADIGPRSPSHYMLLAWGRAGALVRPHLLGLLRPGACGLHRLQALRQRCSSSSHCRAMALDAPGALMRIGSKSFVLCQKVSP